MRTRQDINKLLADWENIEYWEFNLVIFYVLYNGIFSFPCQHGQKW